MPRLNVTQRPDTPNSRQLTPDDAGAGVGRAVQRFGRELGNAVSQVEQSAQVNRRVKQAAANARARRNATEFDVALDGRRAEIEANPDLDARERDFDAARQELTQRFRPEGASEEFDFAARVAGERHKNSLIAGIRKAGIAQGRADGEFRVSTLADQAAATDAPDDRAMAIIQGELEIERQVADGIIGPDERDKKIRSFGQQVQNSIIKRFEIDNPTGGLDFIESPQFTGTELEKQVHRARLIGASEAKLRHSNAAAGAEEKARAANDKRLTREATGRWLTNYAETGAVPQPSEVAAATAFLPEATARQWTQAAMSGGIARGATNSRAFAALQLEAERLPDDEQSIEEFNDRLDTVFLEGNVSKEERALIKKIRDDAQFGAGLSIINTAIDELERLGQRGEAVALETARTRFKAFMKDNRDATSEEALAKANEFYLAADSRNAIKRSRVRQAKKGVVLNPDGSYDEDATLDSLDRLEEAGRVTREEISEILKEMEVAERMRLADEEARAQLGGGVK